MDIQLSETQPMEGSIMEAESPVLNNEDIFAEMLASDRHEIRSQIEEAVHHRKVTKNSLKREDFRNILNSSCSNQRLIPSSLNNDSSREHSLRHRDNYLTENSVDESSVHKSFRKQEINQSFSVSNTSNIRDASSSFSEESDSQNINNMIPSIYKSAIFNGNPPDTKIQPEIKKTGCHCKKSKCLQFYCQCFQNRSFCSQNCNCQDCGNFQGNKQVHNKAFIAALARNPNQRLIENNNSFQNNPDKQFNYQVDLQIEGAKGCKCKKSHCVKKYCECKNSGVLCGIFCRCEDCYNTFFHQNKK